MTTLRVLTAQTESVVGTYVVRHTITYQYSLSRYKIEGYVRGLEKSWEDYTDTYELALSLIEEKIASLKDTL